MKKKKFGAGRLRFLLALGLCSISGMLVSCGKSGGADGGQESREEKVYGSSSNMRHGGLTEGDEELIYYVWEDGLVRRGTDASARTVVDARGGRYLCLAEDTLYYASVDENGKQGIYRLKKAEKDRELVYEASIRGLYLYEDFLYFLEQSETPAVSRVKTDGSGYERLFEGPYDSFFVAQNAVYARNYEENICKRLPLDGEAAARAEEKEPSEETGETEKTSEEKLEAMLEGIRNENSGQEGAEVQETAVLADAAALTSPDAFLRWCEELMPVYEDGWVYYSIGDAHSIYRIRADGSEAQQLVRSSDDLLVSGQIQYEGNRMTDLTTGESSQWSESPYVRLIGLAGGRVLYEELTYDPESFLQENAVPDAKKLLLYDPATKESAALEEKGELSAFSGEAAAAAYAGLLQGDTAMLRNRAEGYLPALSGAQTKECYLFDADEDGDKELFVRLDEDSWLFTFTADGIYCWLSSYNDLNGSYEPLRNGALLYSYTYESGPLQNSSLDIYRLESGGRKSRVYSYQHIGMDTAAMELDAAADTKVKRDSYYSGEDFVSEAEWQSDIEENVTGSRLEKSDWTAVPADAKQLLSLL